MADNIQKQWNIRSKLWLEIKGHPVMGEGRMVMLEAIGRHRSIIQASRETGISYRRMRGAIRDMEQAMGRDLVVTYRGGADGGRSELTPSALALLTSFKALTTGFRDETDTRFKIFFDQFAYRMANFATRLIKEIEHDSSR